ncbi:hypothetical protein B7C42_07886 [Nocardia cerradoensis]|uniref:Uncharacterized protein n=1 Tax=Nocardia cerradoensis TaxID=85688 RepID=A0A231GU81_9NOCA|nr:hypothetical protein [Nocardia cerradoensis]OXR40041.1 hypothetical protein B7C42_07886 [Nocardia cerradoensis]
MTSGNGDPVDEGGQAVKAGFVQAMQSAAMTMNLLQRRGSESRSRQEFAQRQDDRIAEQQRKNHVHGAQIQGYIDRAQHGRLEHWADMAIKAGRYREHLLEMQVKNARLQHDQDRADRAKDSDKATEERRDKVHGLQVRALRGEYNRKEAIHTQQLRRYEKQIAQDRRLHDLKVEYQQLLIEARKRALGLTETLTETDPGAARAHAASAGWAAAEATANLSDEHRVAADAWAERYGEDTGNDPRTTLHTARTESAALDDDADGLRTQMIALSAEYTLASYGEAQIRDFGAAASNRPDAGSGEELEVLDGEVISVAVETTGVTGDLDMEVDFAPPARPAVKALEAAPSPGIEP